MRSWQRRGDAARFGGATSMPLSLETHVLQNARDEETSEVLCWCGVVRNLWSIVESTSRD